MIWFTGAFDLQYTGSGICGIRPAQNYGTEKLFQEKWNARIRENDIVYIVCGLMYDDAAVHECRIERLNGRKILITGDNDVRSQEKITARGYFEDIFGVGEITVDGRHIKLGSVPFTEQPEENGARADDLRYYICGNLYGSIDRPDKSILHDRRVLDVGAAVNGYIPVSFTELEENNETFKLSRMKKLEERALFLALKYHAGQKDKSGTSYIEHLIHVASGLSSDEEKAVGLLHDSLEDTSLTEEKLRAHFPDNVVEAVLAMTRHEGENYFEYIDRVKSNELAVKVKLEDLRHNTDLSRLKNITEADIERCRKYRLAAKIICGENE